MEIRPPTDEKAIILRENIVLRICIVTKPSLEVCADSKIVSFDLLAEIAIQGSGRGSQVF